MPQAIDLDVLAHTLSSWLKGQKGEFEGADSNLSFTVLADEPPGNKPIKPHFYERRLTKPRTVRAAFRWAVEERIIEDNREEWDEFVWRYAHYAKLPQHWR